jgi:MarR family 2-MHQ and catechol resistance regulon transcriptional repressor
MNIRAVSSLIQIQEVDTQMSLHLIRVFAKSFKSVSEHAITGSKIEGFNPTAFAVMEVLYYKGAQPIQQIGAKLLLQSGNVTYVIDKLEERGFLTRKPCANDRRVIFAELTSEGEELMNDLYPKYAERIHRALSGLNTEEKSQMILLLKKMGLQAERLSPSMRK